MATKEKIKTPATVEAKFKFNWQTSNAVPLTQELLDAMSYGNKMLTRLALDNDIEVMVSSFNESSYVSRETLDELRTKLWED